MRKFNYTLNVFHLIIKLKSSSVVARLEGSAECNFRSDAFDEFFG